MARRDLDRVAAAAKRLDSAREELRRAILAARESGETFADIGAAASLTAERIRQIVSGRGS